MGRGLVLERDGAAAYRPEAQQRKGRGAHEDNPHALPISLPLDNLYWLENHLHRYGPLSQA
ncbi:MAG: hypothetical protein M2R45_01688 [Verrucomicrobia subdivision 3 bacterium]|nr:hypothetical protein [Limisphaerales bacterium]MCS1413427.1 hypothetical protein [Limisphaerales bacterium]